MGARAPLPACPLDMDHTMRARLPALHSRQMLSPQNLNGLTSLRLERATGIEPAWPAWKAGTLPLSYTRNCAPFYAPSRGCQFSASKVQRPAQRINLVVIAIER